MTDRERFTKKRYEIQEAIDRTGGSSVPGATVAATLLLIAEQLFEIHEAIDRIGT